MKPRERLLHPPRRRATGVPREARNGDVRRLGPADQGRVPLLKLSPQALLKPRDLLGALQDSSYTVTTSAEHALANLGEMALPQLLRVAGGTDSPRLRPALRAVALDTLEDRAGEGVQYELPLPVR